MCLQDIEIMATSKSDMFNIPILATASQILSQGPDRIGLIFCPYPTVNYWVSTNQNVAVGRGILIAAGTPAALSGVNANVMLNIFRHGDLLRRPWFAIADSGPIEVAIAELFLNTELSRKTGYGL